MPALPDAFLSAPIAHRGLHGPDRPENSLAAAEAAIEAGYGIELDIQPASDGTPMVFHDYRLKRLVGQDGVIGQHGVEALGAMRILGSDQGVPTLAAFLELVAGKVPLLIEIKDQDGRLGPGIGTLHEKVVAALNGYDGPVAVMSFNPHVVTAVHALAPVLPVGLTTCDFPQADWPLIDDERRVYLAGISDYDSSGASFISHDKGELGNPRVDALKAMGVPVLCWTVISEAEEDAARRIADNITFEGYLPRI